MGHMDEDRYTITVGLSSTTPTTFTGCTNVDNNDDELSFEDSQGKRHQFNGLTYHIVEE